MLSCALAALLALGAPSLAKDVGDKSDRPAVEVSPVQLAQHCVERIESMTARSVHANRHAADFTIKAIERLLEAEQPGARKVAERGIEQITTRSQATAKHIIRLAERCLKALEGHPVSMRVEEARDAAVQTIRESAERSVARIREALPPRTADESVE